LESNASIGNFKKLYEKNSCLIFRYYFYRNLVKKAAELTHSMYQITYSLPESKHTKSRLLKMDEEQADLFRIIEKNF